MSQSTFFQRRLRFTTDFKARLLLIGIPAISLLLIAQIFISLINLYNHDNLWIVILSKILLILSFILISFAYIYSCFVNKNNWPQVKGSIIKSHVTRNVFSKKISMVLELDYSFVYNSKKYIKSSSHKITFQSEEESLKFSKKLSKDKLRFINVYVFKYYPKISSTTKKINIVNLLIYGIFIISFTITFLLGFLFHLIDIGVAKIITETTNDGSVSNSTIEFQKVISNLRLIFDNSTITIVFLTLIVLLMFIFRSTKDVLNNKLFYSVPRINTNNIECLDPNNSLTNELICSSCNYVNDLSSIFCFECGNNLWT